MKLLETGQRLNRRYIISECIEFLKENSGQAVLMPTEATYCLICKWGDEEAQVKIKKMKKRFKNTTFQLYATELDMLVNAGQRVSKLARIIIDKLAPAPLTIVDIIDGESLAFSITSDQFLEPIIDGLNSPIAVTSTGKITTTLDESLSQLVGKPDLAVDVGTIEQSSELTTVIQVDGKNTKILREGSVKESKLREILSGEN